MTLNEAIVSLTAYSRERRPLGGFLRACVENDFVAAVCGADDATAPETIRRIAQWIYGRLPSQAWGSSQRYRAWLAERAPGAEVEP